MLPKQTEDIEDQAVSASTSESGAMDFLSAFQRVRKRLQIVSRKILGNQDEADDALQEAFCRLWPKRDSFANEDDAAAVATTTVKNLSIDVLRSRKHFSASSVEELSDVLQEQSQYDGTAEEKFKKIEGIIKAKLTPIQQEIMKRRDYNGEEFASIANDLEMQQTAVRMQLSRARKLVRDCYNSNFVDNRH